MKEFRVSKMFAGKDKDDFKDNKVQREWEWILWCNSKLWDKCFYSVLYLNLFLKHGVDNPQLKSVFKANSEHWIWYKYQSWQNTDTHLLLLHQTHRLWWLWCPPPAPAQLMIDRWLWGAGHRSRCVSGGGGDSDHDHTDPGWHSNNWDTLTWLIGGWEMLWNRLVRVINIARRRMISNTWDNGNIVINLCSILMKYFMIDTI